MYYEGPYQKRRKKRRRERRRRGFGAWLAGLLLRLLALLLVLALLGAGLLYILPVSLFAVEPEGVELSLTDGLPASRANILLLGLDMARENSQRSDTVVVASIGYKQLRLTSVLRDTLVDIPGYGLGKLNAAYAHGGPALVMRTLNQNFDLNIMHYLAVDFTSLVNLVDAIGGVELNVTEAEMGRINQNIEVARAHFEPLGYDASPLAQCGEHTHLNGVQALYYARIRKLDSDFMRTSRQRALLEAMLNKIRSNLWNPALLARLGRALTRSVDTNMSAVQLLSLGIKALAAGAPGQTRLPVEGSYTDDGANLRVDDRQKNIDAFRMFVYDE
ncbi:MAG: LCP family protein [Clostridia bacterium]|nr:LCP family protein [Clostridia bacterium]